MNNNLIFLVKVDLLLHEKTYDELRNFVKNVDAHELNPGHYHVIDYSAENDNITHYSVDFCLWSKSQDLINAKINSGFILVDFATLKSLLSL